MNKNIGTVHYEKKGHICTITINKPENLNILDLPMISNLTKAMEMAEEDLEIRCVVLTAAGGKIFTAGGDIGVEKTLKGESAKAFAQQGKACMEAIYNHRVPVICAVEGHGLGGGLELVLVSDMTVISKTSKLGAPTVKLAATPGWGSTQTLPRVVGISRAKELMYTGRLIEAEEALQLGLVEFVTDKGKALEKAYELAEQIAKMAPIAMENMKIAINGSDALNLEQGYELDTNIFVSCHNTEDKVEGMSAFLEKREPKPYRRR
ncbi:MAG: enoyl-CoA hydratase/isomerase family protein [Anaerovorax sp.]